MKPRILSVAMVGVIVALLIAVVPGPAQAEPCPNSTCVYPPETSPHVTHSWSKTAPYWGDCPTGYACAIVPYNGGYTFFKFYYYGTYSLSNWYGRGSVYNHQTDGASMRLYDRNGAQLACIKAEWPWSGNWDPVWSVRLTALPC